jgi:hypothetical protein
LTTDALTLASDRLASLGIRFLPLAEAGTLFAFERDGNFCLVARAPDGSTNPFGRVGTATRLTSAGPAILTWSGDQPFFVTQTARIAATAEEVDTLRRFQQDLQTALQLSE